jgi:large subunit ribosomal protein L2
MKIKAYRPTTPSQRHLVSISYGDIWRGKPFKSLVSGSVTSGSSGRSRGRVTVRHRGGGHKKLYRIVDFKRRTKEVNVCRLEYDPNRTCLIALVKDVASNLHSYILAPDGVKAGDRLLSGDGVPISLGNVLPLHSVPEGVLVHNIELKIGKGGQIVRSAGGGAQIMGRDGAYVLVKLPSGEVRKIHENCSATIGSVSNVEHKNRSIGKAGRSRWMGRRPHVRGVAMNPIDHPHGGGEGKTSGGRHPVSPWGWSTKGMKTRNKKKASSRFIVNRRKGGRS